LRSLANSGNIMAKLILETFYLDIAA
jgi:hypothetical protein